MNVFTLNLSRYYNHRSEPWSNDWKLATLFPMLLSLLLHLFFVLSSLLPRSPSLHIHSLFVLYYQHSNQITNISHDHSNTVFKSRKQSFDQYSRNLTHPNRRFTLLYLLLNTRTLRWQQGWDSWASIKWLLAGVENRVYETYNWIFLGRLKKLRPPSQWFQECVLNFRYFQYLPLKVW